MDAYFDMLNAEKRTLEDRVYELEYDYEAALQELESCKSKAEQPTSASKVRSEKNSQPAPDPEPQERNVLPKIEFPPGFEAPPKPVSASRANAQAVADTPTEDRATRDESPVVLAVAEIDLPEDTPTAVAADAAEETGASTLVSRVVTAGHSETRPEPKRRGHRVGSSTIPSALPEASPGTPEADKGSVSPPQATDSASRVEFIHLNPRVSGGQDFDGRAGDDGLAVLIEPRDGDGRFVAAPAKITIVVLDPALGGDDARVARWDFDEDTAAKLLRADPLDSGLLFRAPWPDRPPEHERLHVFVRYWCADGRKLETDRAITVKLSSAPTPAWTPRQDHPGATQVAAPPANPDGAVTASASENAIAPSHPLPAERKLTTRPGRFWKPQR
jgi:hypothetical protein